MPVQGGGKSGLPGRVGLALIWSLSASAPAADLVAGDRLRLKAEGASFHFAAIPGQAVVLGRRAAGAAAPVPTRVEPFWLGVKEITVRQAAAWWRTRPGDPPPQHPQLATGPDGSVQPRPGQAGQALAHLKAGEAQAFCRWLSTTWNRRVRLPTGSEWETAARGGIDGAPYPWGWGPPADRAAFALPSPGRPGRFDPNPYGLYDLAGNLWEWCAPSPKGLTARGGSWSEHDPILLRLDRDMPFAEDYRDADVGFRVLVEEP